MSLKPNLIFSSSTFDAYTLIFTNHSVLVNTKRSEYVSFIIFIFMLYYLFLFVQNTSDLKFKNNNFKSLKASFKGVDSSLEHDMNMFKNPVNIIV